MIILVIKALHSFFYETSTKTETKVTGGCEVNLVDETKTKTERE